MTDYGIINKMYDASTTGPTTIPFIGHPEYGFEDLLRKNPFGTQRMEYRFIPDSTGDQTLVDIRDSYDIDDTLNMEYAAGIRALRDELLRTNARNRIDMLISETLADLEDATERNKPVYEVTDDMVMESEEIVPATIESYNGYLLTPLREGEVGDVPYVIKIAYNGYLLTPGETMKNDDEIMELSLDDLISEDNADDTLRNYRPIPTVIGPANLVKPVEIKYGNDSQSYDEDKLEKINQADLRRIKNTIGDMVDMDMPTQIIPRPLKNEKVPLWKRVLNTATEYFGRG